MKRRTKEIRENQGRKEGKVNIEPGGEISMKEKQNKKKRDVKEGRKGEWTANKV